MDTEIKASRREQDIAKILATAPSDKEQLKELEALDAKTGYKHHAQTAEIPKIDDAHSVVQAPAPADDADKKVMDIISSKASVEEQDK